ncbi:Os03g0423700 [Oryza sativa Japonica Group]|uniref:RING-type E3 ubiquitin transferase n=1 Tax=Oryza sativa subsp. japonica TaxID=39947 RepID=A0A0P0VYX0_ORYSJ|nr:Os03g0423700 [Oryza sativa Japonica Group]
MPPTHQIIKVARTEDFSSIGKHGRYFDLVDFSVIEGFKVPADMTICSFKERLTEEFGTPVQCQRLWWWTRRQNNTYRVDRPLTTEEEKIPVVHTLAIPKWLNRDDYLVFLKLYDPEKARLRSEIKFDPWVLCEAIDLHRTFSENEIVTGDIICYQKILKTQDLPKYHSVASFLQHICDQKEEEMKRQILEEKIAGLEHQASADRLEKVETLIAYDQMKHERDNAVRQVNELRDQSTHAILKFSRCDLEQATEHFTDACKVGDTEYGRTYKAIMHGTEVAIKLSSTESLFQQEVTVLGQCRHPNIITFIGVCSKISALVYEWLPNGRNLEDHIVCANNSTPLPWQNRTQIIGEICCALLFLHSNNKNPPTAALIHGDLRPCNILIDDDASYRSRLCNVGLSSLFLQPGTCPPNLMERLSYMDPEFITTGELTTLSDVYSFGVIILRLLTGMAPLNLSKKVAAELESDNLHRLIDKSAGDWPYKEAKQLAVLGVRCAEMAREKRPDLLNDVWRVVRPLMRKPSSCPYFPPASPEVCIPAPFICPILMEIMKDPQVASDGFTYEGEAIRRWFDSGNNRSPMTNLVLPDLKLIPNRVLRSSIHEYLRQQKQQQQQEEGSVT